DFVVAFFGDDNVLFPNTGTGITVQRYHPDGTLIGSPIAVSDAGYLSDRTSIAVDSVGNFVVAWSTYGGLTGPAAYGIFVRQFSSIGQPLTPAFYVDGNSGVGMSDPCVAFAPNGEYMVTWTR